MSVYLAYGLVVLIWATTPLGIQWSSDSVSFAAAAALRMAFALSLALIINALLRRSLFVQPGVWKVYFVASLGIFPNMPIVYWSAQFIPSGLIAVIFALSPFVTGAMTLLILRQNPFNARRIAALAIALGGLLVIFQDQLQIDLRAGFGMAGILVSCFLFSFSSVWLKKLDTTVDAFNQTAGALLFALPGLLVVWYVLDGAYSLELSAKSLAAISYLAVCGSLLGFTLFYYVLKQMSPSSVSLITLITPVLALLIGTLVAGEQITRQLLMGTGLVLAALMIYLDLGFSSRLSAWLAKAGR